MVTSVSTDRGRTRRLQSKSHIQASAPMSVQPCQIPELGTLPSRLHLQSKERETVLSSFPADVSAAGRKTDVFSEAIFPFITK